MIRRRVWVGGMIVLVSGLGHAVAAKNDRPIAGKGRGAVAAEEIKAAIAPAARIHHERVQPRAVASTAQRVSPGLAPNGEEIVVSFLGGVNGATVVVPPNDDCANAEAITGTGAFPFDNTEATQDGPTHAACIDPDEYDPIGTIAHDVWYCWTAPCSGPVEVTTVDGTDVDTKLAVYDGCACPPTDDALFPIGCIDDYGHRWQSSVTFMAVSGSGYLIRLGTYPGGFYDPADPGTGAFTITCLDLPCEQEVSFDTCQPFTARGSNLSDGLQFIVADDFTPTVNGEITGLCWWGSYDPDVPPAGYGQDDTFEMRFYVDSGGLPGALTGGPFVQADGTLSVADPVDTGVIGFYEDETTAEMIPYRIFEHTGTIIPEVCSITRVPCSISVQNCRNLCQISQEECDVDGDCTEEGDTCSIQQSCVPMSVTAGECYWLEITNNPVTNWWYWQWGWGGDVSSLQDGEYGDADANPPIPSSLADGYAARCDYSRTLCDVDLQDCSDVCRTSLEECETDGDCTQPEDTCSVLQNCTDDREANDLAFCFNVPVGSCQPGPCDVATGACCEPHALPPGCVDPDCCNKVCACDPFCCSGSGWDSACAGEGYQGSGCGAAILCAQYCAGCPDDPGAIQWLDPGGDPLPPSGIVDARQPHPIDDVATSQVLDAFVAEAPIGAGLTCWTAHECEPGTASVQIDVDYVIDHGDGTHTVKLERPITPGALARLTYTTDLRATYTGNYAFLPADVNGDRAAGADDIDGLINCINGLTCETWESDTNRSDSTNSQDILRLIDLLNGAGDFDDWLSRTVPSDCP